MTSPVPTLSPQVIGQAESALGALLEPVLARSGTSFHQWLVLNLTAAAGGEADRGQLAAQIAQGRKIPVAQAEAAVGELTAAGLARDLPGQPGRLRLRLTEPGRARFRQIRAAIDEITGRVWGGLPRAELEIAGRLLTTLTERANAELTRG